MILFLYSNKEYEHQAIGCISSLKYKLNDNNKVVYYTIGFKSSYSVPHVITIQLGFKDYPRYHFYKSELSLLTMELFPTETNFIFSDTDILFSKKFDFDKLKHNYVYPLASFGPHEYPFIYETIEGETVIYDETRLMNYFNVSKRSMQYVWSCIYSFNRSCEDFLEEYTSMCQNKYLSSKNLYYYPFADETAFNVCLWKRNAKHNLGYAFLNTNNPESVKLTEEHKLINTHLGKNIDALGADWEYIGDSSNVICYHGFKFENEINSALEYLVGNNEK